MNHEEWLELAEVYALGALDGDESERFAAHLSAGCVQCQARITECAAALILAPASLAMLTPPPAAKGRIFERIEVDKPGFSFTFADQGQWQDIAPGIRAKILAIDAADQRVTALMRMAPGSRYNNHRHTLTEELYILEGSCHCGGQLLRQGDYHRAEAGSIHLDTRTDEGSLMLLITSLQNEMLA